VRAGHTTQISLECVQVTQHRYHLSACRSHTRNAAFHNRTPPPSWCHHTVVMCNSVHVQLMPFGVRHRPRRVPASREGGVAHIMISPWEKIQHHNTSQQRDTSPPDHAGALNVCDGLGITTRVAWRVLQPQALAHTHPSQASQARERSPSCDRHARTSMVAPAMAG
jgi:hypothetical protein